MTDHTLDAQCAEMEAFLKEEEPDKFDPFGEFTQEWERWADTRDSICNSLAPQLLAERKQQRAEIERLKSWGVPNDARMCANCGRSEPCELNDQDYSPCTLDPTYLELVYVNRDVCAENNLFREVLGRIVIAGRSFGDCLGPSHRAQFNYIADLAEKALEGGEA